MNFEELDNLIRMAQVLRIRAENVAVALDGRAKKEPGQSEKMRRAAELAREAETTMLQVRAYFD